MQHCLARPASSPRESAIVMVAASQQKPANPLAILVFYIVFGSLLSFVAGREPGTLPDNIHRELAPVLIVVCVFLVSYSLFDVMAVGVAKQKTKYSEYLYKDLPKQIPEEVHLAWRVQMNQVEQMPVFLVGSLGCALFVNGTVAGVMSGVWVVLRRRYASLYRSANGIPVADIGLSKFTVPAYILSNSSMVMATAIHAVRCLLSG